MKTLLLLTFLAVAAANPLWAQPILTCNSQTGITVGGEAIISVKPDKVLVTFGIETQDTDIVVAKRKNSESVRRAIEHIKGLGIPEKEIKTDSLSIEPRYKGESFRKKDFIGFFVHTAFLVSLTDTTKFEQLLTRVLQSGANYITGVDFQTTELKKYRDQAREAALKDAIDKAEKMAAVMRVTLGAPVYVGENTDDASSLYNARRFRPYETTPQKSNRNVQNIDAGASDTLALGQISVRANVTVTFELKKSTVDPGVEAGS
jgi:uncharacterized protein